MNIIAQVPAVKPASVPGTALTPFRTVDAHSLPHQKASKAVRAVDAADILDGLMTLENFTVAIVTVALGVSASSVTNARRLTPEQRNEVRKGKRPLVLPTKPLALPAPAVPPVTMEVEQSLAAIVEKIGVNGVLDLLAVSEKVAVAA
jgi:hypothetical protein